MPVIMCEGKTDNIYIRCALEALVAEYPTLAKTVKKKVEPKIRLFKYTETTRRLMEIAGGTGDFKGFISNYHDMMKSFEAKGQRFPVILLIDNDEEGKKIYSCVKQATNASTVSGADDFYFVGDNLYVVPTPFGTEGKQTMIEDFLPLDLRKETLGGKRLHLGNGSFDTKTHYGKALFAEHVIKRNRKNINFVTMKPILDRIALVLVDYAKRAKKRV